MKDIEMAVKYIFIILSLIKKKNKNYKNNQKSFKKVQNGKIFPKVIKKMLIKRKYLSIKLY